jgi:hypothetical protein
MISIKPVFAAGLARAVAKARRLPRGEGALEGEAPFAAIMNAPRKFSVKRS